MLKYSVIIPVYNVKEYLRDCIDSVLAQSISDYEVILVNDGSTDGSDALCDTYAAQHPQIHVVHQPNQGVSVARNTGLKKAQGEYVLFLDSDDCWEPNLLELLEPLTKKSPDVIEFGYKKIYPQGQTACVYPTLTANGEGGSQYLLQIFENSAMPIGSSCTCAYRRQLLLDQNLRFPVGVRFGEDLKFRIAALEKAASVYTISETPYRYRFRSSSVTNSITVLTFRDALSVSAEICRKYPQATTANYYCTRLPAVASLSRKDAKSLKPFYKENQDLLKLTSGKRARITRILFSIFGWHNGAKLIRFYSFVKPRKKRTS